MESKSLCNPPNKCWNAHPQHSSLQIFCNIQKSDAIPSEHRTSLAKIGSKQNTFRSPHQSCQNRYLMHMLRYSFKMHSGRGYLPKIIKDGQHMSMWYRMWRALSCQLHLVEVQLIVPLRTWNLSRSFTQKLRPRNYWKEQKPSKVMQP
ncbi:uncharacterized protein LOC131329997 isoform X5 [Rhododendron vialii]|uniref:uncharacterized protein LOC131329997 isoform X5 n=1 Tax=Rhododendron vialii TaxID=182163 RepID=UPI00265E3177|nr:uncharacterized protein LOC131329997 isoform X5 [Rhododendron vialii]